MSRVRGAVFSLTLVASVAFLSTAGVQPAAALCPVEPSAIDHVYSTPFGTALKVFAPGLLVGSSPTTGLHVETSWQLDPDFYSDDESFWGNAAIEYGTPGGARNRLGGFTYTADPLSEPFSGEDSFDYTLVNGCGDEAYASTYVTVVPIVVDSTYTAVKDTPLVVSAANGFLHPDKGFDATFMEFDDTTANGGTVDDAGSSDGAFVYTPASGFVGSDSFDYSVDDINGDNTYTATVHLDVLTAITPPSAPTGVVAFAGKNAATVTWNTPAANGSPITGYTVAASPGGKSVSGTSKPLTVKGLTPGVSYTFNVRAKNAVGTGPASAPSNPVKIVKAQSVSRSGYWMLARNAKVYGFGSAAAYASASTTAAAIAPRRDGNGYWVVDSAGNVTHFGTARDYGGRPALRAGEIVSTISATPSGKGYWLFSNRGRAFVYGDAHFYGDMSGTPLNGPVVASVATPTGHGYYMVGSDGGVFSFGDARFHGSTGGLHLNRPIVGISPTSTNGGYWLVASDGGVFAFDAPFRGSMGGSQLAKPVNGLVAYGNGYLMVASDGGVFAFSNKAFLGSLAANPPAAPIIGIAAFTT